MIILFRMAPGLLADGQCMVIVEQGKIVEFCAIPGELHMIPHQSHIFTGNLGDSIIETFKAIGKRFTWR